MLSGLRFQPLSAGAKQFRKYQSWNRIRQDQLLPVTRRLDLPDDANVFVIGSCFANEIRAVLEVADVAVHPAINPAIHPYFPEEIKVSPSWGAWDERVHYQCYTPFSIAQEIGVALGTWSPSDSAVIETAHAGRPRYWDPYRRAVYADDLDKLLHIRRHMNSALADGLARSKLVVMTLGLIESFKLRNHDGYAAEINPAFADESDFCSGNYSESLEAMETACCAILDRDPDKQIVLTVSPIPLGRTFMEVDVITATMRGKSILRAVAETLVEKYDRVHYWPSYEYVMWSGRGFRADDLRHVRPEIVSEITSAFCSCYFSSRIAKKAVLPWSTEPGAPVTNTGSLTQQKRTLLSRLAKKINKLRKNFA